MRRISILLPLLPLLFACGNRKDVNPFAELLEQPPYLEWTDQIREDPENDSLLYSRGLLLLSNGQSAAARIDLEKAWSIRPQAGYALELNVTLGFPGEQAVFLRKAQRQFPDHYPIQFALVEALQSMDSLQAALSITQSWIQQGMQDPQYLLLHASLLDETGKKAEAISILDSIYALEPNFRPVLEILALRYANAGNEKVLAICQQLKAADSLGNDATPYYYAGIYHTVKKQIAQAHDQFDQAIRADYNFKEAYIEKAALFHDQKQYKPALDILGKALAIAPDYAPVYYWTAKCQQALGDTESAKLNYLKAYGLDQTFLEAKQAADALK